MTAASSSSTPLRKLKNAQEERRCLVIDEKGIDGYGEYAIDFALEAGLAVELVEAGINTGMSQEERLALADSDTSPFMRNAQS